MVDDIKKKYRALNNWAFTKMEISRFWEYSTGKSVRIIVIDSGIPNHTDLIVNKKLSRNFVPTENSDDNYDHATSVVGLMNSQINFHDMEGICPDAEIICLKVLDYEGGGDESHIKKALEYCLLLKPDIVNLSFGTEERLGNEFELLLKRLRNDGTFIVCASGNKNQSILDYPARSEYTLAIGAVDPMNSKTDFSSYGDGIDFVCPGVNLYTTCGNNRYCYVTGTSFAAPIFSGILALYISFLKKTNSEYTYDTIISELKRCSIDLGNPGNDTMYGWGSIDLDCLFQSIYEKNKALPWYQKIWNFVKATRR